jgi:hypothetical protein
MVCIPVWFVLPLIMIVPEEVPVRPYIVWGDMFYMEVLVGYKPRVLPEYFSGSFLPCLTSPTTVRVILLHYE